MFKKILSFIVFAVSFHVFAWIDYGQKLKEAEPAEFGRAFRGVSLKLEMEAPEFTLGKPSQIKVSVKNVTGGTGLPVVLQDGEDRQTALYLILSDGGSSLFSQNLMPLVFGNKLKDLPPKEKTTILDFNTLIFQKPVSLAAGVPEFPAKKTMIKAVDITPAIYGLKAIMISYIPERKPDFAVVSNSIGILPRPCPATLIPDAEKREKITRYIERLKQGAYGGMAVSSQLAALGEDAVDPLIEIADSSEDGKAREARIWAIVTLCSTGSAKAEAYILTRLSDPVSLGDLSFLAWHCQGFGSERVRKKVAEIALLAASRSDALWTQGGRKVDDQQRAAFLEFAFKHFIRISRPISRELMEALVSFDDPKAIAFGLQIWDARTPADFAGVLTPLLSKDETQLPPNLKKAIVVACERRFPDQLSVTLNPLNLETAWPKTRKWLYEIKSRK